MNTKKVTLRLSSTTTQALLDKYQTASFSDALQKCIKDSILHHTFFTKNKRRCTPKKTLQRVRTENLPLTERKSVRINKDALDFLQNYYGVNLSISEVLRCCITDVLHDVGKPQKLKPSNNLFYMAGQKNPQMQEILNGCFNSLKTKHKFSGYVEPFTGTANVLLHKPERLKREWLNDNSVYLVNVLSVLRDYPLELILAVWKRGYSKATFNMNKAMLKGRFSFKEKKATLISRAAAFYFNRYASHYGDGKSYKKKMKQDTFQHKLDTIGILSERLQNTQIKKRDALYYCKTLKGISDHLIYFDSPYIGSEEYYRENNSKGIIFSSHTALRNRVEQLRRKNICVISYRTTASDSMRQNGITDEYVRHTLNRLFCGKDYHYITTPYIKGQIEIVIATVPFEGSTPFNQPLV